MPRTTMHHRREFLPRVTAAGLLASSALLPACSSSPFGPAEEDYARRVALQRLREISPGPLEARRKAVPMPDFAGLPDATKKEMVDRVRSRFEGVESVTLTLEECRAEALRNNLDLKVVMVDPAIASEREKLEDARFESAFTLRTGWSETDSPTASELASSQLSRRYIEPGVTIPLRTGGTATVTLPVQRVEDSNSFSTLNPAYTSDLQFSISHELLRGAGRRANTARLRIAGYERQAAEARTKLEVIRQLAAVDRAYWLLYLSRRELEVAQQQYELAQAQLERAQRRLAAQQVAEIEVIRAEAGLSDRLQAILLTQNIVLLRQRELKRIINREGLSVESPTLVVTATPPDPVVYEYDLPELCVLAVDNRMEMLELELRLAADAAQIDLARNNTLPLLTLDYTYRVNGLGGSMQDTFHTLQRNNFADWEVGLAAQIPIGNEAAKSELRSAILQRIQRLATKSAREVSIRQEVLNAADTLRGDWQRILAARQSVILNTRALQAEQRQFDVGRSTSTDVLDAAARLAQAQFDEARALTDYQISQVDLAFATGTLLGAGKVTWEPHPTPPTDQPDPAEELPPILTEPEQDR